MNSDFKKILDKRMKIENALSQSIFDKYGEKLTRVTQIVTGYDKDIVWKAVHQYSQTSNYAFLYGELIFDPGETISMPDGEDINLTKETVIRINIRLDVSTFDELSPVEIAENVKKLMLLSNSISNEEFEELLNDEDFHGEIDDDKYAAVLDKATLPEGSEVISNFDLSKLSESQKKILVSLRHTASGTKN